MLATRPWLPIILILIWGIIQHHLKAAGKPPLKNTVIDTLKLARRAFPGKKGSLDALCKRFGISLDERESQGHGALLDVHLLIKVMAFLPVNVNDKSPLDIMSETPLKEPVAIDPKPLSRAEMTRDDEDRHRIFSEEVGYPSF